MATLDLASALAFFETGTYTVRRYTAGAYNAAGEFVEGSYSTVTIRASIQPLKGEELERFSQGDKVRDVVLVLTSTPLFTNRGDDQADRIEYGGALYEVVQLEDWQGLAGFTKAYAARGDIAP